MVVRNRKAGGSAVSIRRVVWFVAVLSTTPGLGAIALAEQGSNVNPTPSSRQEASPSNAPKSPGKRTEPASTVTVREGRLSVRVENRSLGWLLEEISREGKVAIIEGGGLGHARVSVQFQDLRLDEGLRQILKDQDAFFFYGAEGKAPASLRVVWVYPKGQGGGLQPVPPEAWASTRELEGDLADPDPRVRARAIETLVERKGDRARNAVLDALKDQDDQVRTRAVYQALTEDVELPTDTLIALALGDPSPEVRFLALEGVADRPEARTIAETALTDPSPQIRNKAQEILRGLDAATRPRPPSQPAQDHSLQPDR
jgi:hypothetical protein